MRGSKNDKKTKKKFCKSRMSPKVMKKFIKNHVKKFNKILKELGEKD